MFFGLFKNIKYHKDLSPEEFHESIKKDKNAVLIDVRSSGEFKGGKIKGAKNLNVLSLDFSETVKNYPKEKNYYIYCRSGSRSARACRIMGKLGFKSLYNLKGGILNWKGPVS